MIETEMQRVVDEFVSRFGYKPSVLTVDVEFELAGITVFQPPGNGLPYLDATIDIVVCSTRFNQADARRVAFGALVVVQTDSVETEWLKGVNEQSTGPFFQNAPPPTNGHILFLAPRLPKFDKESGSLRLLHLVQLFQHEGYRIHIAAQAEDDDQRYADLLHKHGVHTHNLDDLAVIVRIIDFELAVIPFWRIYHYFAPVIRQQKPDMRIIVDSVDLHMIREIRHHIVSHGRALPQLADDIAGEFNAYITADGVLTVSEKEAMILNELTATPNRAHAIHDLEDLPVSPFDFAERRGILFLGGFLHPPNVEALHYLLDEIVPVIDQTLLAANPILVVGSNMPDEFVQKIEAIPNVVAVGWVPSVVPYLHKVRLMVVPVLSGAGTKRKLLQSMIVGTPAVTTSIGAEGFSLRDGEHALISDDPHTFAAQVTQLLTQQALWEKLAANGRQIMIRTHSMENVKRQFKRLLPWLMEGKAPEPVPPPRDPEQETRPLLLFYHLPKTAGTSLSDQMVDLVEPDRALHVTYAEYGTFDNLPYHVWDVSKYEAALDNPDETLRQFNLIWGHLLWNPPQLTERSVRTMTMLRDPVKRYISSYYHTINAADNQLYEHVKGMSLEQYIADPHVQLVTTNNMLSYLSRRDKTPEGLEKAKVVLDEMFFVGITEAYQQSLEILYESMGWHTDQLEVRRLNTNRSGIDYSAIAPEVISEIARLNWLDVELYAYGWQILNRQQRKHGKPETPPKQV